MNLFGFFARVLAGFFCSFASAAEETWLEEKTIDEAQKAVLLVNPGKGIAGTGFFISSNGWVLTSAAQLEGRQEILLLLPDHSPVTGAKLIAMDPISDLAILSTGRRSPHFLRGPDESPSAGAPCAVIIQNGKGGFTAADAVLLALRNTSDAKGSQSFPVLSIAIRPDRSGLTGAPLITRTGRLAGMCDFVSGAPPRDLFMRSRIPPSSLSWKRRAEPPGPSLSPGGGDPWTPGSVRSFLRERKKEHDGRRHCGCTSLF